MAVLSHEVLTGFHQHYRTDAVPALFRAPGRVNLIGEHTDYNLGFVFPIALEMACYVAIAPATHGELRVFSKEIGESAGIPVDQIATAEPKRQWTDYVFGVANQLVKAGHSVTSADVYITSTVPAGSGLSSSAALEVATALSLLGGDSMEPLAIAQLAQRAESQFVGMPCGIMDQYTSVFGREHAAIQIDCRSLTHRYVTLPQDLSIVAVNSNVKHNLGTSAYRERVAECRQAVEALREAGVEANSLRDVSVEQFQRVQDSIPQLPRKRARHIVTDSQRVIDLGIAAQAGDLREMGRLFVASHRSMQYDYEITCDEIDFLVDTAIKMPGVYGSRMTGGGFGGCTVNLVAPEAVAQLKEALRTSYHERFNLEPSFYDCVPAAGAGRVG